MTRVNWRESLHGAFDISAVNSVKVKVALT